jgi:hypothetical protein
MIAYVTVIEKRRIVYKIHVDDPEDVYTNYPEGEIVEDEWLDDHVHGVEFDMEPPEIDWEDHEERPL